ncbi:MAG: outer membrane protein transport protein [Bacteroidota bacterium]
MKAKISSFFLFGFSAFVGFSQGYQANFQGQKQQAMGSAGTGLLLDGASLFFNPGASSFLEKSSINAAVSPVFANVMFQESGTQAIGRTNSPVSTPFAFYAVFKPKKLEKWAFGFAAYTPFGSTISYEDGWLGRFALTRLQLSSIFFQPTVSYKISDKWGIGGGFVICDGKVNLQKDLPVQFDDSSYAHVELSGKSIGFGGNLGLYFKPTEKWSFGLTYRTQLNMKLKDGNADFTVPDAVADKFPDGKFTGALPLPQIASFGVGYNPIEQLKLALDVNFIGFKAYDTLAFDYEQNTSSLLDSKLPRMYHNTFAFRFGAQYKVIEQLDLRVGVAYSLPPSDDDYVTPETPDARKIALSAGLTYRPIEKFQIDASVIYAKFKRNSTNQELNLYGTYSVIAIIPGIGLTYNF